MNLVELREHVRIAQEALDALPHEHTLERAAAVDRLHDAYSDYYSTLGAQLTCATMGDEDTDTPPGYQLGTNDDGEWTFCEGGGSWDDEFTSPDRDGARLECWTRFARSDTAWAERLLTLLTNTLPEVPELPPGYTIGDCEDGTWAIYVDGNYHDGLDDDDVPTSRDEAINVAWWDWRRFTSAEWRAFIDACQGDDADEDDA